MNEQRLWGIVLAAGEGTQVRDFLAQLCGGQGIKQFCAVIGRRSLLEHTLARVERLIPRERILIVVSPRHREEVEQQLAHWPTDNIICQPANCEVSLREGGNDHDTRSSLQDGSRREDRGSDQHLPGTDLPLLLRGVQREICSGPEKVHA